MQYALLSTCLPILPFHIEVMSRHSEFSSDCYPHLNAGKLLYSLRTRRKNAVEETYFSVSNQYLFIYCTKFSMSDAILTVMRILTKTGQIAIQSTERCNLIGKVKNRYKLQSLHINL